ncbi:hypothetical protein [Desulfolithobacter sp.]
MVAPAGDNNARHSIIDTHTRLGDRDFNPDREEVLAAARDSSRTLYGI